MQQAELDKYLRGDRAWFRHQRIAHAKYKLSLDLTPQEKAFWKSVVEANEGSPPVTAPPKAAIAD